MQLMDNTGLSDTELGNAANQVVAACSQRPELSGVRTSYATNTPSVAYTVDREKIKNLGIELSDVFTALQTNFGGSSVNDFTQFGRSYKVIVQADTSYRSQADSLNFISVKSSSGKMVPLDTLLTSSMTTGPSVSTASAASPSRAAPPAATVPVKPWQRPKKRPRASCRRG